MTQATQIESTATQTGFDVWVLSCGHLFQRRLEVFFGCESFVPPVHRGSMNSASLRCDLLAAAYGTGGRSASSQAGRH